MPKSTTQFVRTVAVLMLAMSLLGLHAFAQSTTDGAIGGTVTDQTGAVIPNATVKTTNLGTNATATATSDATGRFRVINLKPGTYAVEISASNFATFKAQGAIVEVGRVTSLEPKMSVSAQTEAVDVTGEAPQINTTSQDFATNINQTSINELPINGRRWSQYALLTPGATPDGNFGLISFRGISGLLNNNTVDGGDNNQAFFSEERGRTRISYVISQASVQEFQVNTSNYSAEYGRSAGGVVNAVTKSGTNRFHGEGFWYIRDNELGAKNAFTKAFVNGTLQNVKPEDRRQQWGGSIGGPIVKDKLFFFFSYDQQKRNFPGIAAPGDPTKFLADLSTAEITTLTNPLLAPGVAGSGRGLTLAEANAGLTYLRSLSGTVPRKGDQDIFLPKIDWKINDKHSVAFVYNRMRWDSPAGVQTQAAVTRGIASFGNDGVKVDTLNAKLTSLLTNNISNELRYSYGRDFEFQRSQSPAPGEPTTANGFPPSAAIDAFGTGMTIGKPNFLERRSYPDERRIQVANSTSLSWGKHLFKFGGDFQHVDDLIDNLFQEAGVYNYNNRVDYISDWARQGQRVCRSAGPTFVAVSCYTSFNQGLGPSAFDFATEDISFFAQDDWHVLPRLTLNMGLRFERENLPRPQIANTVLPQTSQFPKSNNLGPRVGFAWDPFGNGKTAVRGGYGVYYGRVINSTISNAITNTGVPNGQLQFTFSCSQTGTTACTAGAPTYPNIVAGGTAGKPDVIQFANGFDLPRIQQFDAVVERELPWNTVASVSYIGSRGESLPSFLDTNLPSTPDQTVAYRIVGGFENGTTQTVPVYTGANATLARPNSAFGRITNISSSVKSQYDAMVLQVNKRMSHGMQFQTSYTFAKSTDNGQGSQTFTTGNSVLNESALGLEQGRSLFDIRHRFVSSLVWQPNYFKNSNHILKALTSDWTLAPIFGYSSGKPYTGVVSGNSSVTGRTASGTGIEGAGGSNRPRWIPINNFEFPSIYNVDMRVSRRVPLKEGMNLEFLAEAFNLFNHMNVTDIQTRLYTIATTSAANTVPSACTGLTNADFNGVPTNTKVLCYNPAFGSTTGASSTLYRERQVQFAIRFQF